MRHSCDRFIARSRVCCLSLLHEDVSGKIPSYIYAAVNEIPATFDVTSSSAPRKATSHDPDTGSGMNQVSDRCDVRSVYGVSRDYCIYLLLTMGLLKNCPI